MTRQIQLAPASSAPARGSEYAELSRQIKEAGLLERRPGYYTWKIAVTIGMLAAGWAAFVVVGDSWWQLAVAAFLAVVFTQVGFLGHDAGHRQIFGSRRASYVAGILLGNLAHRAELRLVGRQAQPPPRPPQPRRTRTRTSQRGAGLHRRPGAGRRGVARLIARYQAYLFFPMLLLEGVSLHVASVRALTRRACPPPAGGERCCSPCMSSATYGRVRWCCSPVKAWCSSLVQQGLFGLYLGCSFAPNHKGMPILTADDERDFLRRQVLTSRNVRGGWLTDFALGGLNYQIEHHLFPSMPRPNLRRSQALVGAFCQQHGVPYCETSLAGSYAQALRHLNTVGRRARPGTAT